MLQLRVFKVEEANSLIPELHELILSLREKREEIAKKEVEIDALELVVNQESESGIGRLNEEIAKMNQTVSVFDAIVDKIHAYGCFLKDVEAGLIDFYGIIDGKVVYLCWKLGEDKIRYWHEVGEGYRDRRPFPEERSG